MIRNNGKQFENTINTLRTTVITHQQKARLPMFRGAYYLDTYRGSRPPLLFEQHGRERMNHRTGRRAQPTHPSTRDDSSSSSGSRTSIVLYTTQFSKDHQQQQRPVLEFRIGCILINVRLLSPDMALIIVSIGPY